MEEILNASDKDSRVAAKNVDWRGIRLYLLLCFGVTWSVEIAALLRGIRFATLTVSSTLLLATLMLVPAVSAYVVRRWITREGFANAGLRLGSPKGNLCLAGRLWVFAVIYAITCALGLGIFSTDLTAFSGNGPHCHLRRGFHLPLS